jgi:hypothetical protein
VRTKKNIIGEKKNRLTVLSESKQDKNKVLCLCSCGNKKEINRKYFMCGSVKSCGCLANEIRSQRCKVEIGDKYGFLTVISKELTSDDGKINGYKWVCNCVCGKERKCLTTELTRGIFTSCGCKNYSERRPNKKFEPIVASFRAKAANYKSTAKQRGIEWSLNMEEATHLLSGNCFYCGSEPSNTYNLVQRNRAYTGKIVYVTNYSSEYNILYNGIDRTDNEKGYVIGNVVTCCQTCNFAKRDLPYEKFINWINQLVQYQSKK